LGLKFKNTLRLNWTWNSINMCLMWKTNPSPGHRLRGSASPVLTATGFVNGKWQFSTTTESTPLNRSPKNVTSDYVGDHYGCAKLGAYPFTGSFWAYGWNITKIIFIYALFWRTHLQVRPVDGFSRMMAQTTRTCARMCLFGIFSYCSHLGGQKPQTPQFWGMNSRFQAKLAKSKKNMHIIKTTASIPTTFCTVTTKGPSWVVPTHA